MKKRGLITLAVVVVVVAVLAVAWVVHQPKRLPDSTQATGSSHTIGSLHIKEWNVELPLSSAITDAYYTYDASSDEVFISTTQLDTLLGHIHGCTGGLHGLYYKEKTTNPLSLAERLRTESLCAVPASSETEQIGRIQSDIRAAARAAFAD